MEQEKKTEKSSFVGKKQPILNSDSRGGARPGAGRPKGSGTKLTIEKLLSAIDNKLGVSLEDQIAQNYVEALADKKLAFQYEQMFLNKVMADRQQIEIDETSTVESRQVAFLKALESIGTVSQQHDNIGPILPDHD